jgi:uncharacterized membrane protein
VFLAGVAAYLSLKKGKNKQQMARFLLIRGLWLIFLELTVVSLAWMLYLGFFMGGVLWAIGWSMIILASIVHLPIRSIAIFGITLIVGHNLFDSIQAEQLGHFSWIWSFLHERTMFDSLPGIKFFLVYPIIPWVGVMATGYAFGTVFTEYGLAAFALPYLLSDKMPDNYGYSLHHVYVLWILMLVILYPICNWFDRYKSQHQYWWLNYL